MRITGINDVLGYQQETSYGFTPDSKLYNLWHELPAEQRGSDAWKGKWGTLMHILLPDFSMIAESAMLEILPGRKI